MENRDVLLYHLRPRSMKPYMVLLGVAVVGVVGVGLANYAEPEIVENYPPVIFEEPVIEQVDVLDEAQEALDKANALLDEEETRLLAERAIIDQRLEQIIEKRTSF